MNSRGKIIVIVVLILLCFLFISSSNFYFLSTISNEMEVFSNGLTVNDNQYYFTMNLYYISFVLVLSRYCQESINFSEDYVTKIIRDELKNIDFSIFTEKEIEDIKKDCFYKYFIIKEMISSLTIIKNYKVNDKFLIYSFYPFALYENDSFQKKLKILYEKNPQIKKIAKDILSFYTNELTNIYKEIFANIISEKLKIKNKIFYINIIPSINFNNNIEYGFGEAPIWYLSDFEYLKNIYFSIGLTSLEDKERNTELMIHEFIHIWDDVYKLTSILKDYLIKNLDETMKAKLIKLNEEYKFLDTYESNESYEILIEYILYNRIKINDKNTEDKIYYATLHGTFLFTEFIAYSFVQSYFVKEYPDYNIENSDLYKFFIRILKYNNKSEEEINQRTKKLKEFIIENTNFFNNGSKIDFHELYYSLFLRYLNVML